MPHTTSSLVISIVVLSASFTAPVRAQDPLYALADKIGPQGSLVEDGVFGTSVAIDGDLAVVGAPGGNTAFAFVNTPNGWQLEAEIPAPEFTGTPLDISYHDFGESVAISGNVAVIGAPRANIFAGMMWHEEGAVCVFRRSAEGVWELEQELTVYHMDFLGDTHFGASVAISDQTIIAGAPDDTRGGEPTESGSAFIFSWTGAVWHLDQRLKAPFQATQDHFGAAVDVSVDTAVIGVPYDDVTLSTDAGRAFVFTRSGGTWTQTWEFTANNPGASDHFGAAVSVTGTRALVGAPDDDHAAGTDAGSAHLFTGAGASWARTADLTASDADTGDRFGAAVSVDFWGDVLVGAPDHNLGMLGIDAGAAYLFTEDASVWVEDQKIIAPKSRISDHFGSSVALDEWNALVGAPGDDVGNIDNSGSADLFAYSGGSWRSEEFLHGHWETGLYEQFFGYSMAVDGDTMVVALPKSERRSAQIFVRDGDEWLLQQELLSHQGYAFDDQFGFAVDVSGDTAVVGAQWGSTAFVDSCGLVYVFIRTSTLSGPVWELEQILEPSDASHGQVFGRSVDIEGDDLVVGSPKRSSGGGVYVFNRSGTFWTEDAILEPSDMESGDEFGSALRLVGNLFAAGAPRDDDAADNAGAVRLFTRAGSVWTEGQKITAATPQAGASFGFSIDIDVSSMVIGAINTEVAGNSAAGSAHVFVESGGVWSEQQQLVSPDPGFAYRFGAEVLIFGDTVVVASPFWGIFSLVNTGAVRVFHRSGAVWTHSQLLFGSPIQYSAHFGSSIAATGDGLAIGAYYEDFSPVGRGAVYFHTVSLDRSNLSISVTNGQAETVPGTQTTYSITVINDGPNDALGATITDAFPPELVNCIWSCVGTAATCTPGPVTGDINDTGYFLVNGRLDYTATCNVDPSATGDLINSATVTPPPGVADPNMLDNTDTDTDTLTPLADLSITKDNGTTEIMHLQPTTYTIQVANAGPSDALLSAVVDLFPPALANCSWTCTADPGAWCKSGSIGDIDDAADLPVGTSVTFVATCTVVAAYGQCSNTANVFAQGGLGIVDPDLGNNESTDTDDVIEDPDLIFFDHFETGDTSRWDTTVP